MTILNDGLNCPGAFGSTPAPPPPGGDEQPPPDPGSPIPTILAWVGTDPARAQTAYDAEVARTNPRSTLITELLNRGAVAR